MIDARGYSCPMPVVMVQNEVKKNAPASLEVLVDSMTCVENVSRFAEKQGTEAFLQASRKIISDAFLHSAIPFEEVVKNLRFERSTAHAPLFQYAFTLQNFALSDMALDGVSVQMEEPLVSGVKFDLTFSLFRTDTEIAGNIEYDADLFTLEYVERILEDYVRILEAVIGENTPEIEAIDLSAQNVIEASENPFDSLF